jgi:hypothetical protein
LTSSPFLLARRRFPPHDGGQIDIIVRIGSKSVTHQHHPVIEKVIA